MPIVTKPSVSVMAEMFGSPSTIESRLCRTEPLWNWMPNSFGS